MTPHFVRVQTIPGLVILSIYRMFLARRSFFGQMCMAGAVLFLSCSSVSAQHKTMFPVPKGAFDVGHVTIRESGARQDHYSIKLPYPSDAILEHYRKVLGKSWEECIWGQGKSEWWGYGDTSNGNSRYVHQREVVWVNRGARSIIFLGLRYISPGPETRRVPDHDIQNVIVLRTPRGDLAAELKAFGISCSAPGN
jgi:hypothetical protein